MLLTGRLTFLLGVAIGVGALLALARERRSLAVVLAAATTLASPEIPSTVNHREGRDVAPRIPLARGWERRLDRRFGALFYDGRLNAATYRAWLDEREEARLVAAGRRTCARPGATSTGACMRSPGGR